MTLTTLADMRELVERYLPPECCERDTWRHVAAQMNEAARGGDIDGAVIAFRLVLQLERVPCLPQRRHTASQCPGRSRTLAPRSCEGQQRTTRRAKIKNRPWQAPFGLEKNKEPGISRTPKK
jgi:hypothetical protein